MTPPSLKPCLTSVAASLLLVATAIRPCSAQPLKNIVLVHGAFVDGSGWQGVYDILVKDGYRVTLVQQPLTALNDDVAAAKRILDLQDGPCVLVGHSYGGAVITEAGTHRLVAALVYNFAADFAADLPPALAAFMAHAQIPTAVTVFNTPITNPAWKLKPSWYAVAKADKTISPDLERMYAARAHSRTVEIEGASHAVYISHPKEVAALIEQAARNNGPRVH